MKIKSRVISGMVAGCAALALSAVPAAAAPVTVSTDAGTTCRVNADASLGGGLVVKPVSFSGTIDCSLADRANPVLVSGALGLQSSAPLGIGGTGGQPNDPDANESVLGPPGSKEGSFRCELEPGTDCGLSGKQPLGLTGQTYTAFFGVGLTPPEGETWIAAPGCTLDSGPKAEGGIACSSNDAVTVR